MCEFSTERYFLVFDSNPMEFLFIYSDVDASLGNIVTQAHGFTFFRIDFNFTFCQMSFIARCSLGCLFRHVFPFGLLVRSVVFWFISRWSIYHISTGCHTFSKDLLISIISMEHISLLIVSVCRRVCWYGLI